MPRIDQVEQYFQVFAVSDVVLEEVRPFLALLLRHLGKAKAWQVYNVE